MRQITLTEAQNAMCEMRYNIALRAARKQEVWAGEFDANKMLDDDATRPLTEDECESAAQAEVAEFRRCLEARSEDSPYLALGLDLIEDRTK